MLTSIGGALGVALGFLVKPTVPLLLHTLARLLPETTAALPPTILQLQPRIAPWSCWPRW